MVDKQKQPEQKQAQEYDNTLKVLFGDEAAQILPRLVPGTVVHEEKNIEIDRSQLKADLVYRAKYKRRWHIVNVELQTGADKDMQYRLLQYHVGLHAKYKKPVLSIVLYPFARSVPTPPYRERGGDGELLTWKYRVIALYTIEAEPFVREQAFCMYSMLPAMKGVTVKMLLQVLEEMKQHYTTKEMEQHLTLFWRMLQKSRTLTKEEKEQVGEVIKMEFNWWIDTNPEIKKRIAKGKVEGELGSLRQAVLNVVQAHFPAQLPLAQQRVSAISKTVELHRLLLDLIDVPDETAAMLLLSERRSKQSARRKKPQA